MAHFGAVVGVGVSGTAGIVAAGAFGAAGAAGAGMGVGTEAFSPRPFLSPHRSIQVISGFVPFFAAVMIPSQHEISCSLAAKVPQGALVRSQFSLAAFSLCKYTSCAAHRAHPCPRRSLTSVAP